MLYKGVFVSLIGRDLDPTEDAKKAGGKIWLAEVAKEVEQEIGGKVTSEEEVAAQKRQPAVLESIPSSREQMEKAKY